MREHSIVRSITEDHAAAACHVLRESITHCCLADHQGDAAIIDAWLANKTTANVRIWLAAEGAIAVGAFKDDELVGMALAHEATLTLCYVVRAALHQGVGRALLDEVMSRAKAAGVKVLSLESTRTAEPFYRRQGFEPSAPSVSWGRLTAQPMRRLLT